MRSERGQAGIELLLIVGGIILIAISVYPTIKIQKELNQGVTAARDGATYAANMMSLGFTEPGSDITQSNKTIQIVGMTYSKGTASSTTDGLIPVAISFEVKGTSDIAVGEAIANQSLKFIYKVFYADYAINDTYVVSDNYRFTTSYTFV